MRAVSSNCLALGVEEERGRGKFDDVALPRKLVGNSPIQAQASVRGSKHQAEAGPCTSQPLASVVAKTRVLASQLQQFQTRREPSEAIQLTRVTRIASGPCFCTFFCTAGHRQSGWKFTFLLRVPFEVSRVRVLYGKMSWQPLASLASQLLGEPSLTQAREW